MDSKGQQHCPCRRPLGCAWIPGGLDAMQTPKGCAQAVCLACCLVVVAAVAAGRVMQTCVKQQISIDTALCNCMLIWLACLATD